MKVITQEGDRVTVEMTRLELDSLVQFLIDVDGKEMFLDGEELGDLSDHITHHISEMSRVMN